MAPPEQYFILIYDVPSRALEIERFGSGYGAAAGRYSALEEQHRNDEGIEVVLVGADSIETIQKTHSHYFAKREDDLFQKFLEVTA